VRDDHAQYLCHWLSVLKSDSRAIFTAAAHAQPAADHLHGLQPTPEPQPPDPARRHEPATRLPPPECQEFWVQKNLYLTADASYAFRQAYDAALNHKMLKDFARDRKSNEANTDVSSTFSQISSAGNVIRNAIELPPLKDRDLPTPET
jgi:zincin-like metallopeptidase